MTISNHKSIGILGLGKMGRGIALQLAEKGWDVVAYNRTRETVDEIVRKFEENQRIREGDNKEVRESESQGDRESVSQQVSESEESQKSRESEKQVGRILPAYSYQELVDQLPETKVIWVMVPSGDAVKQVIEDPARNASDAGGEGSITELLSEGDYLIDAGNSYFKNTQRRYEFVESKGINYVDAGVSGGPSGARNGACIMVGGSRQNYDYLEPVFKDLCVENGYQFFEGKGAGHFVKMVHNGIEYGMMQAIAEGFDVMKQSEFDLNLTDIAKVYEHGSVIESSLVTWMRKAFEENSDELTGISDTASHSGEGEWTVKTAEEMNIPVKVIKDSLQARIDSEANPNFQAKIISALREQFGGHPVRDN